MEIHNKIIKKYQLFSSFLYTVFCFYISAQFSGPAYWSDEIGYLSKAAVLARHSVNWPTSWHAGYSILLIPAFLFDQQPDQVWINIMLINSLMMGIAFLGLQVLLLRLFPKNCYKEILLATLLSALYPSFIVMSGYAFATPAFVMCYILSLLLLNDAIEKNGLLQWAAFAFLNGYLYWIHPLGIIPSLAAIPLLTKTAKKQAFHIITLTVFIMIGMIISYHIVFLPFLDKIMGKGWGGQSSHYTNILNDLLTRAISPGYWMRVSVLLFGQVGAILINSFALVYHLFNFDSNIKHFRNKANHYNELLVSYISSVMFGIIFMGTMSLSSGELNIDRGDYYIYGRYIDMCLLPVIGISFLSFKKSWKKLFIPIYLVFVGIILDKVANKAAYFDRINIISFWPIYFYGDSFFIWFLVGAILITILSFFSRSVTVAVAFIIFIAPITYQLNFHRLKTTAHSNPSAIAKYVRLNYKPGSTIYFDSSLSRRGNQGTQEWQITNIYVYYFYDYILQASSFKKWQTLGKGPFISSHDYSDSISPATFVVGRNLKNSLIVYDNNKRIRNPLMSMNDQFVYGRSKKETAELLSTLYLGDTSTFKYFRQVGILKENAIHTTGKSGLLLYGPYIKLAKGKYNIFLEANIIKAPSAHIEITSDLEQKVIKKVYLKNHSNKTQELINIPFNLDQETNNFEIRVIVDKNDSLSIKRYIIKTNNFK